MRSQPKPRTPPAPTFSEAERRLLLAIAAAAIPDGRVLHGADTDTVTRTEAFLVASAQEAGAGVLTGYRALLWALEGGARLTHGGRGFVSLDEREQLAVLEAWRHGSYPRRQALRALLSPAKLVHFSSSERYREVGCVYGKLPVAEERPRWMEQVYAADDVAGEALECEVVVIGTGAGGAVVAKELAERGVAVVMLEEGEYHTRAEFNGRAIDMQRKLYRDLGATFSVGNTAIQIPYGKSVGGTTTINSGTCYRAPDRVFRQWQDEFGLGALSPEALAPYYEKVEEVLGVGPSEARYLGGMARVIARGCDSLGWKRHGALNRNAPGCDGQGVCCFGCPTDAKRSTNVSYVPAALRAGAMLVTGARAERVMVEGGRAVGVVARSAQSRDVKTEPKAVTVRARAVVVACGTLLTPLFLEANGLGGASGQLGRNLSIHPAAGVAAMFDEPVEGAKAVPQGYGIEEFHDEGLLFEGAFAPLEIASLWMTQVGPRLMEVMESFDRMAAFGFMIEDVSRGRVRRGPGGRPFITYVVGDEDVARLKRGVELLCRVFLAAGARRVLPLVHGFDELRSSSDLEQLSAARLRARDFDLSAYHPLGTARMGADPRRSVVGADHQLHDLPGLYVVDGSAVPSSLAVNPQLTIMALATRAAELLAARLA